ncbi:hypothetical protein HYH03_016066 [Edaphochlamys debaryana]|uniref:Gamma tubulin complex component C-terminal domain-containing protein n=1 Tax=Edaphochlamys debaryana TaxID=47281 RepID=A0A835XI85_9CHLO|nr:hypothetical protein HYH03_016066 [Edaphochlamys debaryana]|eukprot:KAG2485177.1 hypothetical protein HYH03_016066 [Edaphochlamys debaryana]
MTWRLEELDALQARLQTEGGLGVQEADKLGRAVSLLLHLRGAGSGVHGAGPGLGSLPAVPTVFSQPRIGGGTVSIGPPDATAAGLGAFAANAAAELGVAAARAVDATPAGRRLRLRAPPAPSDSAPAPAPDWTPQSALPASKPVLPSSSQPGLAAARGDPQLAPPTPALLPAPPALAAYSASAASASAGTSGEGCWFPFRDSAGLPLAPAFDGPLDVMLVPPSLGARAPSDALAAAAAPGSNLLVAAAAAAAAAAEPAGPPGAGLGHLGVAGGAPAWALVHSRFGHVNPLLLRLSGGQSECFRLPLAEIEAAEAAAAAAAEARAVEAEASRPGAGEGGGEGGEVEAPVPALLGPGWSVPAPFSLAALGVGAGAGLAAAWGLGPAPPGGSDPHGAVAAAPGASSLFALANPFGDLAPGSAQGPASPLLLEPPQHVPQAQAWPPVKQQALQPPPLQRQGQGQGQHAVLAARLGTFTGAGDAEQEVLMYDTAVLALAGVGSALRMLRGGTVRSRRVRLSAQRSLLAPLCDTGELRLRLGDFVAAHGTYGSYGSTCSADGVRQDECLAAFADAVRDLLALYDGELRDLAATHRTGLLASCKGPAPRPYPGSAPGKKGLAPAGDSASQAHGPGHGGSFGGSGGARLEGLLGLVLGLTPLRTNLQCLADVCLCVPDPGWVPPPSQPWAPAHSNAAAKHAQAGAGPGARPDDAAQAQAQPLAPSLWQVYGFARGPALLERLYGALMQAEPSKAPLLRLLFASASAPYLRRLRAWLYDPTRGGAAGSGRATDGGGQGPTAQALEGPPAAPGFAASLQRAATAAGLQMALLSELGPELGDVAGRLRRMAAAEAEEARLIAQQYGESLTLPSAASALASASASGRADGALPAPSLLSAPGWGQPALSGAGAGAGTGADEFGYPLAFSMGALEQLSEAAAAAAAARDAELSALLASLDRRRAAEAEAADEAAAAAALAAAAVAEEARAAKAAAAEERRLARSRLAAEQRAELDERAARQRLERERRIAEEQAVVAEEVLREHNEAAAALAAELAKSRAAYGSASYSEAAAAAGAAGVAGAGGPAAAEAASRLRRCEWREARMALAARRRLLWQGIEAEELAELRAVVAAARQREAGGAGAPLEWQGVAAVRSRTAPADGGTIGGGLNAEGEVADAQSPGPSASADGGDGGTGTAAALVTGPPGSGRSASDRGEAPATATAAAAVAAVAEASQQRSPFLRARRHSHAGGDSVAAPPPTPPLGGAGAVAAASYRSGAPSPAGSVAGRSVSGGGGGGGGGSPRSSMHAGAKRRLSLTGAGAFAGGAAAGGGGGGGGGLLSGLARSLSFGGGGGGQGSRPPSAGGARPPSRSGAFGSLAARGGAVSRGGRGGGGGILGGGGLLQLHNMRHGARRRWGLPDGSGGGAGSDDGGAAWSWLPPSGRTSQAGGAEEPGRPQTAATAALDAGVVTQAPTPVSWGGGDGGRVGPSGGGAAATGGRAAALRMQRQAEAAAARLPSADVATGAADDGSDAEDAAGPAQRRRAVWKLPPPEGAAAGGGGGLVPAHLAWLGPTESPVKVLLRQFLQEGDASRRTGPGVVMPRELFPTDPAAGAARQLAAKETSAAAGGGGGAGGGVVEVRPPGGSSSHLAPGQPYMDEDLSYAPVGVVLHTCVFGAVQAQYRLTTRAVWHVLVHEYGLLRFCLAMRRLFFAEAGDVVGSLADSLRRRLEARPTLPPSTAELRAMLDEALAGSSLAAPPGRRRWRRGGAGGGGAGPVGIAAGAVRVHGAEAAQAQAQGEGMGEGGGLLPALLDVRSVPGRQLGGGGRFGSDCAVVTCRVPRPLDSVLTPDTALDYADVLSALLRLRCTASGLTSCWAALCAATAPLPSEVLRAGLPAGGAVGARRGPGAAARRPGLHPLWAARLAAVRLWLQTAIQVVSLLLQHMQVELQGRVWGGLASALRGPAPRDLVALREAHRRYLAEAREVVLLPPSPHQHPTAPSQGPPQCPSQAPGPSTRAGAGPRRATALSEALTAATAFAALLRRALATLEAALAARPGALAEPPFQRTLAPALTTASRGLQAGPSAAATSASGEGSGSGPGVGPLGPAEELDQAWAQATAASMRLGRALAGLFPLARDAVAAAAGGGSGPLGELEAALRCPPCRPFVKEVLREEEAAARGIRLA